MCTVEEIFLSVFGVVYAHFGVSGKDVFEQFIADCGKRRIEPALCLCRIFMDQIYDTECDTPMHMSASLVNIISEYPYVHSFVLYYSIAAQVNGDVVFPVHDMVYTSNQIPMIRPGTYPPIRVTYNQILEHVRSFMRDMFRLMTDHVAQTRA